MSHVVLEWIATPLLLAGGPPSSAVPRTCPVTVAAAQRFAEPSPSPAGRFWYGSEALAVLLRSGGIWRGMNRERRYRNKLVWWRQGFDGRTESRPALVVKGRRLDRDAPPADVSPATNARHSDFGGWAIMNLVEFPTSGCWELTGEYRGEKLRFVVLVEP